MLTSSQKLLQVTLRMMLWEADSYSIRIYPSILQKLFCIPLSYLISTFDQSRQTEKLEIQIKEENALRQINKISLKALGIKVMDVYIDGL